MQPRFDGSLMTSLAELRAIEEERIASERASVLAEVEARKRAQADAEQRARDAEEARVNAAREAELTIARDRERAEREARMHVEAAEATERARLAAALEQERTAQELDLRRQEVAKKRPTWMIAVTIGAVLAAGGLTWFGIGRYNASQQAIADKDAADRDAAAARKEADDAIAALAAMDAQLQDLDKRVGDAIDKIIVANDVATRLAAKKNLEKLRAEEAELQAKREKERQRLDHIKRVQKVEISEECKKNPLARGCGV